MRAKRTLADAGIPFEVPHGAERAVRLASVLDVVYLVFNEGYAATSGDAWTRPQLCDEAIRLGRILAALAPDEPEVHGLLALMELQASRLGARTGPSGEPILLLDQNRARWDSLLIRHGLAALDHAEALGPRGALPCRPRSPPATPARRRPRIPTGRASRRSMPTSWRSRRRRSPSSTGRWRFPLPSGRRPGSRSSTALTAEPSLKAYHLLPSVRGDLLAKLGRLAEARTELERAAGLTRNAREREMLLQRVAAIASDARR